MTIYIDERQRATLGSRPVEMAELADALVDLGGLALAFGRIDRTAVYHPDGVTPESDTDHTAVLVNRVLDRPEIADEGGR